MPSANSIIHLHTNGNPGKFLPPRLVILGPPACGIGFECELLMELLVVVHLSNEKYLRQAIQDKTTVDLLTHLYFKSDW
ncbi:adenylate [Plasmopara halstedii]|uniref:Adenylate n=1 Tax=Plasmopara halstedii TaxID=4781 RepID=A0A0P1AG32_PLAHL|nr:adenylate [Plasmopara halstedii]CEG40068.1 adenylate [Plasmopara halstedii]|eukprot:XP_024576437.1 adenylate [Plasmopara halstedii]